MNKEARIKFLLEWADNVMILGQRLSEWCGHGPILEQDIAITNIALDLIGEARNIYQYTASLENNGRTEDYYPFLRLEQQFYNVLLVEQPNTDWAYTIVRQNMFDTFHYFKLLQLKECSDETIAAIATKSLKEVTYHLRYSSEWMMRLGDGTEESHAKMQKALNDLYKFFDELFERSESEQFLIQEGVIQADNDLKSDVLKKFNDTASAATLLIPQNVVGRTGGKKGIHSEHMGYILTTMQYMQRTYPEASW